MWGKKKHEPQRCLHCKGSCGGECDRKIRDTYTNQGKAPGSKGWW